MNDAALGAEDVIVLQYAVKIGAIYGSYQGS
jgi:hypothetical protein